MKIKTKMYATKKENHNLLMEETSKKMEIVKLTRVRLISLAIFIFI